MNARAERFPLMDSLRAIAALSVLAYHAAFFAGMYDSDSPLRPFLAQPTAGVTVFFVISGFLLYRPFVSRRLAGEDRPDTKAYAWRRFLRIVPAYWLALTVIAVWLSLEVVFEPGWHVPVFYGFGQIYAPGLGLEGVGQAWTLCVEVTFYAFLPLWAFAVSRLGARHELVALAGLWLASLAWKLVAVRHLNLSDSGQWLMPLPNFLDQFAVGMALAVISVRGRAVARVWPWLVGAAVAYWVLSTQIGIEGTLGERLQSNEFILRHELATLVAVGLIVPVVFARRARSTEKEAAGLRAVLFLGVVSYGIYLWHLAVVSKIARAIAPELKEDLGLGVEARFLVLFLLGGAGATVIAAASYYALERPALSLKRLVRPGPASTLKRR